MAPKHNPGWLATASLVTVLVLVMGGCAAEGGADDGGDDDGGEEVMTVAASTSVWASVLTAVAGEHVEVTSMMDDASADPHSYESTPEDGLVVSEADLLLYNGGGYDVFAQQLAEQEDDLVTLEAVTLSGHDGGDEHEEHGEHGDGHGHAHGTNEHIWYDVNAVSTIADAVADELGTMQPENSAEFARNAAELSAELDGLAERLTELGEQHSGLDVLATEPVAHYLLDAADIDDITPTDFSDAIETQTDVPVAAQDEVHRVVDEGRADMVINNPQTTTPVTEQLVSRADDAGIPVVDIAETVPEGVDYVDWVSGRIDALSAAVPEGHS